MTRGSAMRPAIEVMNVSKEFPGAGVRALDGAGLVVEPGEWVAVTGPSGSGKSTLLHLIAALDRPTAGAVLVGGRELDQLDDVDAYRRHTIGLVFQLHHLLAHLDARGNIEIAMFGTHTSRRDRRRRATELLTEVHLADKARRKPPELSGGERQRVALARALANGPAVLLADEPTGSLDPVAVRETLDLFRRLQSDHGVTIVMVTHDVDVAASADRTVRLEAGRFVDSNANPPRARGPSSLRDLEDLSHNGGEESSAAARDRGEP
jgi:putative ABC transport system ATP-binding protein